MTPEATRNLLIRRRELTGETFNDHTIKSWGDLLADVDYNDAVAALNKAATEQERVNVRHLHEHMPRRPRPEQRPTIGDTDCTDCEDGTGFIPFSDRYGTIRYMPCPTCRPTEAAKIDRDHDHGQPIRFAVDDLDGIAQRAAAWTAERQRKGTA